MELAINNFAMCVKTEQQTFPAKGQAVNIFICEGHCLCCKHSTQSCDVKEAMGNMETSEYGCATAQLYLQTQAAGQSLPVGHSLPASCFKINIEDSVNIPGCFVWN